MLDAETIYTKNTLSYSRMASVRRSCILLSDGRLYEFGNEEPTCSGNNVTTASVHTMPKQLNYFPNIKITQISVGNQCTLFLSEDNRIFGVDSNQFGQLGNKHSADKMFLEPVQIEVQYCDEDKANSTLSIKKISTGVAGSTIALTHSGNVYTCGENNGRPIGTPHNQLLPIAKEVFDGNAVIDASVGGCSHLFITDVGHVYTCGYNDNAEGKHITGHAHLPNGNPLVPMRIDYFSVSGIKVVSGSAGRLHSVVIDDQGRLYGWGCNRHGQLGLPGGGDYPARDIPIDIDAYGRVVRDENVEQKQPAMFTQVDCGWYHTLALSITGEAFSFGANMNGIYTRSAGWSGLRIHW